MTLRHFTDVTQALNTGDRLYKLERRGGSMVERSPRDREGHGLDFRPRHTNNANM